MRIFFYILCLLVCTRLSAQSNGVVVGGKWANQIFISDVNGRPFENRFDDVNGTPYFDARYKYADITLKQGRTFTQVKAKINLVTQETIFESSNGIAGFMEAGVVKKISYADTTTDQGIVFYIFQSGFPAIDKQSDKYFYQVLVEGKCSYVRSMVKKVSERKNELSGEIVKEFETTDNYYLFHKGEMKRLKKDKDFILSELADKQEPLNVFITSNKLNLKNQDHLIKLLKYYNSL